MTITSRHSLTCPLGPFPGLLADIIGHAAQQDRWSSFLLLVSHEPFSLMLLVVRQYQQPLQIISEPLAALRLEVMKPISPVD